MFKNIVRLLLNSALIVCSYLNTAVAQDADTTSFVIGKGAIFIQGPNKEFTSLGYSVAAEVFMNKTVNSVVPL